jgi:hypothetical protein
MWPTRAKLRRVKRQGATTELPESRSRHRRSRPTRSVRSPTFGLQSRRTTRCRLRRAGRIAAGRPPFQAEVLGNQGPQPPTGVPTGLRVARHRRTTGPMIARPCRRPRHQDPASPPLGRDPLRQCCRPAPLPPLRQRRVIRSAQRPRRRRTTPPPLHSRRTTPPDHHSCQTAPRALHSRQCRTSSPASQSQGRRPIRRALPTLPAGTTQALQLRQHRTTPPDHHSHDHQSIPPNHPAPPRRTTHSVPLSPQDQLTPPTLRTHPHRTTPDLR